MAKDRFKELNKSRIIDFDVDPLDIHFTVLEKMDKKELIELILRYQDDR